MMTATGDLCDVAGHEATAETADINGLKGQDGKTKGKTLGMTTGKGNSGFRHVTVEQRAGAQLLRPSQFISATFHLESNASS